MFVVSFDFEEAIMKGKSAKNVSFLFGACANNIRLASEDVSNTK